MCNVMIGSSDRSSLFLQRLLYLFMDNKFAKSMFRCISRLFAFPLSEMQRQLVHSRILSLHIYILYCARTCVCNKEHRRSIQLYVPDVHVVHIRRALI